MTTENMPEKPANDAAPLAFRMVGDLAPLFAAKAKARLAFQPIQKDRHVVVQSERGKYEFDYATLEEVLARTTPALAENGLDLWHFLCDAPDGAREVHHMLTHASGAFIEAVQVLPKTKTVFDRDTRTPVEKDLTPQEFGSAVTYSRRYAVQCLLGVSAEHDDDGNAASGNTIEASSDRQPKRREPPAPKPIEPQQTRAIEPPKSAAKPPSVPPPPASQPYATTSIDLPEPMTEELLTAIRGEFVAQRYNAASAKAKVLEVCGKPRESLTRQDGELLLETLRSERAAS